MDERAKTVERPDDEELRIALVLNGGVSLAVWIGGVVQEANRLVQCGRLPGCEIYRELLKLTATKPRIDVISGASAGGLNGGLLAWAMANRADLGGLRTLWVEKAAFADLLRDPFEADPPSLLNGDGYFLDELQSAFDSLRSPGTPTPPVGTPIILTMAGTLLNGKARTVTDDFGSRISDMDHRATFRFVRDGRRDDFADPEITRRLALAARSTASFPGAFEASFSPVRDESAAAAGRPNMRQVLRVGSDEVDRDRFVVDGGVLNNKPIGPALDAIFNQRCTGEVRRVLAYVVPDPEPAVDASNDQPEQAPTIASVLLASLVDLPRVESISEELGRLRQRNQEIRERRRGRVALTEKLLPEAIDRLAGQLYALYRSRRIETSVDYIVEEVSRALAAGAEGGHGLGQRGRREWLTRVLGGSDLPWIPGESLGLALALETDRTRWAWGTGQAEHTAQIVLDALRRTQRLARARRRRHPRLEGLWNRFFDRLEEINVVRAADRGYWKRTADQLRVAAGNGTGDRAAQELTANLEDWVETAKLGWSEVTVRIGPEALAMTLREASSSAVFGLAALLVELDLVVRDLGGNELDLDQSQRESLGALLRQLRFFVRESPDDPVRQEDSFVLTVVKRLLLLETVTRAIGDQDVEQEELINLMQISGDGRSPLGGKSAVAEKLAGVQLSHFGGFYKRSWRANDWMFGRLDASRRFAQMVLDPERLRIVGGAGTGKAASMAAEIERIVMFQASTVLRAHLERRWNDLREQIARELAYLDSKDAPVPERLEGCLEMLVYRMHYDIVHEELPGVYQACQIDRDEGASRRPKGAAFVSAFEINSKSTKAWDATPPQKVVELFCACQIGEERIEAEIGSDLFTSVATQSLAVVAAAGQGRGSGLGPLRPVLKAARVPMLGAHLFARAIVEKSRTTAALLGMAVAYVLTVLPLACSGSVQTSSPFFRVACWLLVGGLIATALHWPRVVLAALLLAVPGIELLPHQWIHEHCGPLLQRWAEAPWRTIAGYSIAFNLLMVALPAISWFSRPLRATERFVRRILRPRRARAAPPPARGAQVAPF